MKRNHRVGLAAVLFFGLFIQGRVWAEGFEATSSYEKKTVEGWTVYVSKELAKDRPELAGKVVELLRVKLYEVGRVLPAGAVAKIHDVPIWMEWKDRDVVGACYHPSVDWLRGHGFNPDKAGGVEIGDAEHFLSWSLAQPAMVLHELSHAYHHRVLGYDNSEVKAAYDAAVASHSYDSVLNISGRMEKAYAMNNPQEYFAECSEAYFGTNDFYPFVRAELEKHDPGMYALLKKVWNKGATTRPAVGRD